MLSVTFSQPIVIDPANLHSLLSLANAPATVQPYMNGHAAVADVAMAGPAKRGRKPKANGFAADVPLDQQLKNAAAAAAPKKERAKRRTKAEMAAARSAAAGDEAASTTTEADVAAATTESPATAPKKAGRPKKALVESVDASATPADEAPPADSAGMLERFAKLIDSDFTAAKAVLDQFGVNRFSDLKPVDFLAFGAKLVELGV